MISITEHKNKICNFPHAKNEINAEQNRNDAHLTGNCGKKK